MKINSSAKVFDPAGVNSIERMNDAHPSRLISRCLAGDEAAIETLVRQHETGVFRLALSVVGDAAEATEITQQTFISALRSLPTYQEKKTFKAWLYTIALNHSRSHLRKRKARERLNDMLSAIFRVEAQKQVSPEEAIIRNEKEDALWKSLHRLDERFRTVVVLRYFHEMSIAEISEILEVNEGTIHSRLHTARERLRDAMQALDGE
jgi:RNA polymerase sigma-70 factor (ECF subfamily)